MSRQVDERVVSMQFDNRMFERNVSTTMSTLDKLKQSLHLPGASKGLENVSSAAKNVNMSGLSGAVETVRTRFSALEVMGVTALANITNSAVNAGKRIVSALTIDPIKTGFNEYETKINSVQTIMSNTASKGTTMADVTAVLDELNQYADMTIYNFAEMTRNIGTFTAAGVGLEDSAAAIQGIANLAAASGSNSQQASTAMYQLSQALSTGTVKLMDWNSVVNAGMGGEKFQEALKATAREHGTAVDSMIKGNGSFRDSLKDGWLTAEVLNDTLKKFTVDGAKAYAQSMVESGKYTREQADALIKEANAMNDAATKVKTFTQLWDTLKEAAQSGWAQTWELIVGDFEEAKTFLSGLSDLFGGIIDASSKARNALLGGALNSKWDTLSKKIEAAGLSTDTFKTKIIEVAKAGGIPIDKLIKKHGTLEAVIAKGLIPVKLIKKAFMDLLGVEKKVTDTTKELGDIVNKVINGSFGNGKDRIDALTKAGYDYATVQNAVNEKLGSGVRHLSTLTVEQKKNADSLIELSDAQLKNKGYTAEQIMALRDLQKAAKDSDSSINELINNIAKPTGRELLLDSLNTVIDTCVKSCGALKDAWQEIFPPMTSEQLYNIIAGLNTLTGYLAMTDENADKLKRTFKGVFALLDIVLTLVGGPLRIAFKAVSQLLGMFDLNLLDVTASMGDAIVKFRDWIDSSLDFTKIFEKIMPCLEKAAEGIRNWINTLKESDNIPRDIILGLVNGIKAGVPLLVEAVFNLGKLIITTLKDVLGIHSPARETYLIAVATIQGFIKGFIEACGAVWGLIKGFGSKVLELFGKIDIGKVLALGLGVVTVVAGKQILDVLNMFAAPLAGLGDMLEGIGGMFLGLKSMFKGIGASFRASALKKSAQAVLIFAVSIGVLVGALWLLTKIDKDRLWESVGVLAVLATMIAALGLVMAAMSKIGTGMGLIRQAASMILISLSLLILVNAISKIVKLDDNDIKKGIKVITQLSLLIVGMIAVSKLAGGFSGKAGSMLLKVSITLLIMIGVIKLAAGMSDSDLSKGLMVIAAFELLIIALIGVSKLAGKFSSNAGSMLLKISVALLVMVGVIKLAASLDNSEIAKGLKVIAAIEILFGAIIAVSHFAGANATKAGAMLLMMSAAVLILVGVIKLIADMDNDDIAKGLVAIAAIEILFGAIIVLSKFAGANAAKAGAMLLMMSVAIVILAGAIFLLSEMDPAGVARGLAVVSVLMILCGALVYITKFAGIDVSKTLITLAVVIGLLVAAVAVLSMIDPQSLIRATAALAAIMVSLAILIASTKFAGQVKIGQMAILLGVVAGLAAIVWALSGVNPESVIPNTIALSTLLLALSAAMVIIDKTNVSVGAVGIVALMGLVLYELTGVLYILSQINPNPTLQNALLLSTLLVAISAAIFIIDKTNVSVGTVGIVALMGLVMYELTGVLFALSQINPDPTLQNALVLSTLLLAISAAMVVIDKTTVSVGTVAIVALMGLVLAELILIFGLMEHFGVTGPSLETALGLSALLLALSGVCLILSAVGATAPAAITGAMAFVGVVAIIGGLFVALGGLVSDFPIIEVFADKGIALLEKIGLGLGSFFGHIVGGIIGGIGGQLPQVGTDLSNFINNLKPFIEGVKSIDGGVLTSIGILSASLLALTGASVINEVLSMFTGGTSLDTFGAQLEAFGKAVVTFSGIVSGNIDEGAVTAAANAGRALSEMISNLPKSGGALGDIFDKVFGTTDMAAFGTQLESFGKCIVAFSGIVSGNIDEGAVTAAANAGRTMSEMASNLPKSGGWMGEIFGENDIDTFGRQLESFGTSIVTFSGIVAGNIDEGAVTAAANAGKVMSEMASNLPNSGGWMSTIFGDNDIDTFGKQLETFGKSIVTFSETVSGNIDEGAVTAAASAGKMLSEMANNLPDSGGWVGAIFGDNDMDTFGTQLESFGDAIVGFSETVSGKIDVSAVSTVVSTTGTIIALCTSMPADGVFPKNFSVYTLKSQLKAFGEAIVGFSETISGKINVATFSNMVSASNILFNMCAGIPAEGVFPSGFSVDTLKSQLVSFGGAIVSFSEKVSGTIDTAAITTISNVSKIIINMCRGIPASVFPGGFSAATFRSQLISFAQAVKDFASEVATVDGGQIASDVAELKRAIASLKDIGDSGVTEFTNAFTNSGPKISTVLTSMVESAAKTITDKKNEFKDCGEALVTAFVKGINSKKTEPQTAVKGVVSKSVSEVTKDSVYTSFYNAGGQCVQGFANGISANSFKAEAQARAMARAAAAAAEAELDIESPSKVFYKIGSFAGMGLVNALNEYTPKAYKAGSAVANSAAEGLRNSISKVAEFASGNIDVQPTIKPVLDLSDITSGANTIQDMFATTPSIGVLSNISAINSSMNRSRQNGINGDVVSAIKRLEGKISNLPGNKYVLENITYDDGSNIATAVQSLVRAARVERRV